MPSNDLGYLSHYPVLAAALAKTTGPVLELGMGWGSTPLLHAVCVMQKRTLHSFESDRGWVKQFSWMGVGFLEGRNYHEVCVIDDWSKLTCSAGGFDLAFIDFAPGEIRKDLALMLKGKAKFILLHDALQDPPHAAGNYQYDKIIPKFRYHEYYGVLHPPTLILSDDEPFGLGWQEQEIRRVL